MIQEKHTPMTAPFTIGGKSAFFDATAKPVDLEVLRAKAGAIALARKDRNPAILRSDVEAALSEMTGGDS